MTTSEWIYLVLTSLAGEPVYKDIGSDQEGNRICVPFWTIPASNLT